MPRPQAFARHGVGRAIAFALSATNAIVVVLLAVTLVMAFAHAAHAQAEPLPEVPGATTVTVPAVGLSLGGYMIRPPRRQRDVPAVLLLHGAGGNAEDLLETARSLADRGYIALALTMRGFRGSDGEDDCGAVQADDTAEALNWLSRQTGVDSARLGILGFGQGAQVALLAASRTTMARAVVAYFPITDIALLQKTTAYESVRGYLTSVCEPRGWELVSPVARAKLITAPVLLIHGAKDDRTPVSQSETMRDALTAARKQVELHVLPAARHDFTIAEFEESWPWVMRFLGRNQMLSLASRSAEQQKRVNIFTEEGWSSKLGARSINTIRGLGPVKREKSELTQNPHVKSRKDEVREFFFDGLYVRALFPGQQHDAYLLQEVDITKPRWKVKYSLNIGATRSAMLDRLGQPDGEHPDFVEYFQSMGIGTARIYLRADRITKLEWEFLSD